MTKTLLFLLLFCPLILAQVKTQYRITESPQGSHLLKKGELYQQVTLIRPSAVRTSAELTQINPLLPKTLQDFPALIQNATLSPHYKTLYDLKIKEVQKGTSLTSHNYFDCATILNITHPSGQKVVWIQADMDVVTDGTDPNRFPLLSDYNEARHSDWFLPATGYSWGGASRKNPFLSYYPEAINKLAGYKKEFQREAENDGGVIWRALMEECDFQSKRMQIRYKENLSTMQSRRSLVATADPFIVIPLTWFREQSSYALRHGDKAAVIYGGNIIPAIVGDAGPSYKIGEASLRIAKALNPKASGKVRAVDSLGVTYLIFPKTAEQPRGEPSLPRINAGVKSLLEKIGGVGEEGRFLPW